MIKINRKLLPIKAHYFFFMAAMGPVLPQLPVLGKELGVSSMVIGTITGILPIIFLIAKPVFGLIVDILRNHRKSIFMGLILIMTVCFALLGYVPPQPTLTFDVRNVNGNVLEECTSSDVLDETKCDNQIKRILCSSKCFILPMSFLVNLTDTNPNITESNLCKMSNETVSNDCDLICHQDFENGRNCLYKKFTFWAFVVLMSIGSIGFNVVNSISDAICFDVIGQDFDYGKQRVWGTIGYGCSALIAGYAVDYFSGTSITYTPALFVMVVCSVFDLLACIKLKLPIMEASDNIFKDLKNLMKDKRVVVFLIFAVFSGIVDSFIVYYLFWYLEDLAQMSRIGNIKLLEGVIVAAETLGGEVIFFSISGMILKRFGHVHCFSMCFINYALRLGLISIVPSPWWIVPIEIVFQGPTYALTYTTIVAYANELAPPGASATMQGIAAGMDDGFGYAVGSFMGGLLYKYLGGKCTLQIFSLIALVCSIVHLILHKTILKPVESTKVYEYKSPEEAIATTLENYRI
ncbi:uncharacterized protein LOC130898309 isoform X1 [Diorhabda carinulata]|uniref:uncharacterized protein LOC130898309 isoform X1 n=1 Tax=Diorhabda carinulata TaxID=1163345 RepID=UPI0025A28782|nr:uncharacterized protein LOC130898309 isoform X1 [Diorhabda carinulata]XP_057663491.1 uncharacterized protein LOC130898309 isoform X1 [Diorhabda carinulata]